MTESTHTSGPWRATGPNIRTDTELGNGAIVATVQEHWHDHKTPQEEKDANARLIAAAPELKTALVECVRVLGEYTGPSMNGMNAAFENALSAIAKATGGSRRRREAIAKAEGGAA